MVHYNTIVFKSMLILYGDRINYHHDMFVLVGWLRFVVKVLFDIGRIVSG